MSTVKEVEALLRKTKKELREVKKDNEEKDFHIKFLNERLDNWAEKNAQLREEKLKITIDDVIAFQKQKLITHLHKINHLKINWKNKNKLN